MNLEQLVPYIFYIFFGYLALINLVAASVTAYDKHISRRPRGSLRRVPEKTFVRFSMLGGGIGTLGTMLLIRHKTRNHPFLLFKITLCTVLWIALLLFLLRKYL